LGYDFFGNGSTLVEKREVQFFANKIIYFNPSKRILFSVLEKPVITPNTIV